MTMYARKSWNHRRFVSRRSMLRTGMASFICAQAGQLVPASAADLQIPPFAWKSRGEYIIRQDVRVFTNRQPTRSSDIHDQFGTERGPPTFGKAEIAATMSRVSGLPVASQLRQIHRLGQHEFFDLSAAKAVSRKAMLFCHGYNCNFEDALQAGARLKSIVGSHSPMFVQSWPSLAGVAGLLGYIHDVAEIDFATPLLREALSALLRPSGADRVQLIAHSLGARAMVAALKSLYDSEERQNLRKVSEVVFAAPDVDQDIMDRDFLPVADFARFNSVVYVSNRDLAMWLSETFNGQPRAGSTDKKIYLRKQITTIEVSLVDPSRWGHSAIFGSPRVASDIHYFLNQNVPTENRYGLRRKSVYEGDYWCMEP
jgi:esterase/lipase superfamily enzyme